MTDTDYLDYSEKMWNLTFSVRRSFHYHDHRERFFSLWHRAVSLIWIVTGSVVVWNFFKGEIQGYLVLIPTILSVIDVVIGFAEKMSAHKILKQRFIQLETEIVSDPSDERYAEFHSKRRAIEADEPPKLHALDLLCHNEVVRALYDPEDVPTHLAKIPWLYRATAQFLAWPKMMEIR